MSTKNNSILSNADKQIVSNLRQHFGDKLVEFTDSKLALEYLAFALSDWHGDNDARFLEWLGF